MQRSNRLRELSSALVAAAACAVVATACSEDPFSPLEESDPHPALSVGGLAEASGTPVSLTFTGGTVTAGQYSVLKGWLEADDQFWLELTLTELLSNGDTNDLAEQFISLSDFEAVFSEKAEAIIDVNWTTASLAVDSAVLACAQVVIKTGSGGIELGELRCASFNQP